MFQIQQSVAVSYIATKKIYVFIIGMAYSTLNSIHTVSGRNKFKSSSTGTLISTSTFAYTGANQSVTVPATTTYMVAQLWGAGGATPGNGNITNVIFGSGGGGGFTSASLNVTSGTVLTVIVGQAGNVSLAGGQATATYGGGGGCAALNGDTNWRATSGGGRCAIQISSADIITAGGGGGGGHATGSASGYTLTGGAGGGLTGGDGGSGDVDVTFQGKGGTQSAGGAAPTATSGGTSGTAGSQYTGGTGCQYCAGGGGGYYGGGGGNYYNINGQSMGAGGGGSSYVSATYLKSGTTSTITQASGRVVAANSSLPSGVQGTIGNGGTSGVAGPGQNGYVVISFYK